MLDRNGESGVHKESGGDRYVYFPGPCVVLSEEPFRREHTTRPLGQRGWEGTEREGELDAVTRTGPGGGGTSPPSGPSWSLALTDQVQVRAGEASGPPVFLGSLVLCGFELVLFKRMHSSTMEDSKIPPHVPYRPQIFFGIFIVTTF